MGIKLRLVTTAKNMVNLCNAALRFGLSHGANLAFSSLYQGVNPQFLYSVSPDTAISSMKLWAKARIRASNSTNAVSISSARTTKGFPSSRCASAIQIVRPSRSSAETRPQLQPALLRLSAMISILTRIQSWVYINEDLPVVL